MDAVLTPLTASVLTNMIELVTSNIDNPTELNAIGTAVEDLRLVHENVAGADRATFYRLDTSSATVSAPWVMASATAGLQWIAICGYACNQAVKIANALSVLDATDHTKIITWVLSSLGTGITLTLKPTSSTSQTLQYPNITATDTLATLGLAQTFAASQTFTADAVFNGATANPLRINGMIASRPILFVANSATDAPAFRFNIPTVGDMSIGYRPANTFVINNGSNLAGTDILTCAHGGLISTFGNFSVGSAATVLSTTAATTSLTGGLIVGDQATAATNVGIGGGVVFAGTSLIAKAASGSTNVVMDSTSAAAQCGMSFKDSGTTKWQIYKFTDNSLYIADLVNSINVMSFSPGAIGSAFVMFPATTPSNSVVTGCAVYNGGLGVAKNIICGGTRGTGVSTNATLSGTVTLTSTSTEIQTFTGSTAGTVIQFPAANLFGAGIAVLYTINNQSSVTVTPTRAGADTFQGGGTTDPVLAGATTRYASNGVSLWMKV